MTKIMTNEENKKWQRAFWALELAPIILGLLLWAYVSGLSVVGLCSPSDSWPPDCRFAGAHLTKFIGAYLTILIYGYLFYAAFAGLVFGVIVLARIFWLKSRMKHKSEVLS